MTTTFNTTPVLDRLGNAIVLATMLTLTVVSAAALAQSAAPAKAEIYRLPTVVVTAKRATPEIASLPTVVVMVKRANTGA